MASSSSNVVGVHYRVGKKIGEGSFGVIFEGMNLLNSQQVAIKFVRLSENPPCPPIVVGQGRLMRYAIGTEKERCSPATR
jgi:serine/threonine protein kinase